MRTHTSVWLSLVSHNNSHSLNSLPACLLAHAGRGWRVGLCWSFFILGLRVPIILPMGCQRGTAHARSRHACLRLACIICIIRTSSRGLSTGFCHHAALPPSRCTCLRTRCHCARPACLCPMHVATPTPSCSAERIAASNNTVAHERCSHLHYVVLSAATTASRCHKEGLLACCWVETISSTKFRAPRRPLVDAGRQEWRQPRLGGASF